MRVFLSILFLLTLLETRVSAQQPAGADSDPAPDRLFRMVLTGDSIITRRISPFREPEFIRMIDLIRGADAAFTNLEILFHDYEPWPMHESGGSHLRAEPALAKELVWAGFDLVSMANNHTGDYGPEGARLTRIHVAEAGLVGSGAGDNLFEAREAKFLETNDGRIAIISVASTYPTHSAASKPMGAVRGRPGLSPLRVERVLLRRQFERLRSMLREIGVRVPSRGDRMTVSGREFVASDSPGAQTRPNEEDLREIAAVVSGAAKQADYVMVTIHAHESFGPNSVPAEFLPIFARAMIDAGADLFVGHGPHVLRGIEIYKGKPIFYSLGNFLFQHETVLRLPHDSYAMLGLDDELAQVSDFNAAWFSNDTRGFPKQREVWESVIAVPTWQGDELLSIELHPITLGFGEPTTVRGRPMLADPILGRKIVEDLIQRSSAFGTIIEWRDGIGVVKIR